MGGFAVYPSLVGDLYMRYEEDVLLELKRIEKSTPVGVKTPFTNTVYTQLCEYFAGERTQFTVAIRAEGTVFQQKVWKALCDIAYGETKTYKDIAIAIGNPNACRAVGMANHRNPIGIIIPCHRVVGSNGALVGYAGGVDMKATLLSLEKNEKC